MQSIFSSSDLTRLARPCLAAAILLGLGASPAVSQTANGDVQTVAPSQIDSMFGAYSAARHAESISDFTRTADLLDRILSEQPDDPLLQQRGMMANLHAGRIARAVELARPQVAVYPSEVDIAALTLAADAMVREDWERAIETVVPAHRIALARFAAPLIHAWSEFGKGSVDEAVEALTPLRDSDELPSLHNLHAGLMFLKSSRAAEAEAVLSPLADDLATASVGIVRALARARIAVGDSETADDLLRGYDALNPGLNLIERDLESLETTGRLPSIISGPRAGVADSLVNLGLQVRHQAPLIALRYARIGVYLDPENDLGRMVISAILESLDRYGDAIEELQHVRQGSAYDWDARMEIADNLIELERDEEAIARLESMASERTDDLDVLDRLGWLMRLRERYEEGTDYYSRALARVESIDETHWSLFYHRGITLERTKRWPEAEADFKKALELRPGNPYVLNYLGYSWVDQGIHIEEALTMIREAVDQEPNDGYIVDSLGWAYYRLENYEEAVVHLERAVQLRPQDPIINDHLGDAYWHVGRQLEATFQWKHALTLEPEEDLRATIEEKLEEGLNALEEAANGTGD